jgi:DNA-directed RNA polymerase subunit M/transcription elongation factor TFIIS
MNSTYLANVLYQFDPYSDQNDINSLMNLNDKNNVTIFNINDNDIILCVLSIIKKIGIKNSIIYLNNIDIFNIWNMLGFEESKNREEIYYSIFTEPPKGIKGVGKCAKCNSTELSIAIRQVRSADEPMTVFFRCINCNHNWSA